MYGGSSRQPQLQDGECVDADTGAHTCMLSDTDDITHLPAAYMVGRDTEMYIFNLFMFFWQYFLNRLVYEKKRKPKTRKKKHCGCGPATEFEIEKREKLTGALAQTVETDYRST